MDFGYGNGSFLFCRKEEKGTMPTLVSDIKDRDPQFYALLQQWTIQAQAAWTHLSRFRRWRLRHGHEMSLGHEQPESFTAPTEFFLFFCPACQRPAKGYRRGKWVLRCPWEGCPSNKMHERPWEDCSRREVRKVSS